MKYVRVFLQYLTTSVIFDSFCGFLLTMEQSCLYATYSSEETKNPNTFKTMTKENPLILIYLLPPFNKSEKELWIKSKYTDIGIQ